MPILFPDRIPIEGLISLQKSKTAIAALAPIHQGRLNERYPPVDRPACLVGPDAILFAMASSAAIRILVGQLSAAFACEIVPQAWNCLGEGFLGPQSIQSSKFIVVQSLFPHGAIEVELDGAPLYVVRNEFYAAIASPATSKADVRRIGEAIIEGAISEGIALPATDLVERVRNHTHGVSNRQIEEVVLPLRPESWRKRGPKRARR